ncbi:HlyD family type I secretion periplasmic adaptor subunit [Yoonia litorea]|uniref:Membrane fusion protein (MFP) family protein n=1 Tax=Yoonia litorea TaxID=1123755 RepID=A0A1I6LNU9_9RHOB|nr:HlyD family type I secretion periplasmic adaptor subunit [Yoonia litorea]SFS05135.1 HlyD family secretion protein/membrane fusion protein, epimerase transport system [Yoonia litorea]
MAFLDTLTQNVSPIFATFDSAWTKATGGGWDRLSSAEIGLLALLGAAAVISLVLVINAFRPRHQLQSGVPLKSQTRSARILGFVVVVIFFGVFGGWTVYAPLASAAVAPGVVSPDGSRKTVQHLEGGIIQRIHVREGQHVAEGEMLVTLESVRALSRLQELREQHVFLLASQARLEAEANGHQTISFEFPNELIEEASEQIDTAVFGQIRVFESRRETQLARSRILGKRIDQLNEEINGLSEVIAAQDAQLELIAQELDAAKQLYDQGLQRLSPYLALQRQEADLRANRAANRASIARLGQQIGETELQLFAIGQQAQEEVSAELSRVRSELSTVTALIPERIDALRRTTVTAPIAGQVLNIRVTTEAGGILRPGGEILDIVPDDAALIVDARVSPRDIDTVVPGMSSQVLLTAYAQRNLPRIFGTLQSISADRLVDERTGEPYFLAKVHVDTAQTDALGDDLQLIAGMPADVMILTGERTMFDYLIKPFSDSLGASFREN